MSAKIFLSARWVMRNWRERWKKLFSRRHLVLMSLLNSGCLLSDRFTVPFGDSGFWTRLSRMIPSQKSWLMGTRMFLSKKTVKWWKWTSSLRASAGWKILFSAWWGLPEERSTRPVLLWIPGCRTVPVSMWCCRQLHCVVQPWQFVSFLKHRWQLSASSIMVRWPGRLQISWSF